MARTDVGFSNHSCEICEDVHEAVDAVFYFDEGAEIDDAHDFAVNDIPDLILFGDKIPRLRLQLLITDRYLLIFRVPLSAL